MGAKSGTKVVTIELWGRQIGHVAWDADRGVANFSYTKEFQQSKIQLAPFTMPLSDEVYSFPELSRDSYKGLPGLLSDSLPDKFGMILIKEWLESQGRSLNSFSPIEHLCYMGKRGMGALEYVPQLKESAWGDTKLELNSLVELANQAIAQKDQLSTNFSGSEAFNDILRVGTSAGGARAKAIIAWNRETNEIRSGHISHGEKFSEWLIKFDGVDKNSDKESADPLGFGKIEYTYYQMALNAGIQMNESMLLEDGKLHHFMTRRFDRDERGAKLHMQSLCAMRHFDFNFAGHHSYEEAMQTIQQLKLPHSSIVEQFRRMVFNVVARNQDDHTKNISFLMNKRGEWSLSPAYDITYSYNPDGMWTGQHQMSINGKRDDFTKGDLIAVAKKFNISPVKYKQVIEQVGDTVGQWSEMASANNVDDDFITKIEKVLRKDILSSK